MSSYLTAFVIVVVLVVLFGVGWRHASRRRSLPCPSWLVPLLENPYVEALAGSIRLLDRADVGPGMCVLDIGSGPGRLALPAAERVAPSGWVLALDVQPSMVRKLEERIAQQGIRNIKTLVACAGEGQLKQGSFDRAFLVTVLGEITDQSAALCEIRDALRPGGILSVTEVFPDPHYQSRKRVRRLVEGTGFNFDKSFGSWLAFTMNFSKLPPVS